MLVSNQSNSCSDCQQCWRKKSVFFFLVLAKKAHAFVIHGKHDSNIHKWTYTQNVDVSERYASMQWLYSFAFGQYKYYRVYSLLLCILAVYGFFRCLILNRGFFIEKGFILLGLYYSTIQMRHAPSSILAHIHIHKYYKNSLNESWLAGFVALCRVNCMSCSLHRITTHSNRTHTDTSLCSSSPPLFLFFDVLSLRCAR